MLLRARQSTEQCSRTVGKKIRLVFKFIIKRLGISALVMLAASVILFILTINAGDPLGDLRESTSPNRQNLIDRRIAVMHLNDPWYTRYFAWLGGTSKCFVGACDFGTNFRGQRVNDLLVDAMGSSLRLVFLSTVFAIVLGVFFGVMTAIRQYSGFDYAVTFISFAFFSLPSFVFAVLLKEYGAIKFNDWLEDPTISFATTVLFAAIFALFAQSLVGGSLRRRTYAGAGAFLFALVALVVISSTKWFLSPQLGWGFVAVVSIASAVLFASLFCGLSNRRALACTLGSSALSFLVFLAAGGSLWQPTWGLLFVLLLAAILAGVVIGFVFGGYAKRSVVWANVWTACAAFLAVFANYMAEYWADYTELVGDRPVATVGAGTPNFQGGEVFWLNVIDTVTHLLLPTISLTLISFASYTRYTRSSMLEVLGQDYIRTARSKGLPERTVVTRHAFRNAMIPITTIVATDFANLIGGAVITESIFGWQGMGALFRSGLDAVDPMPVMAFFTVTGTAAIVMNMVADILYAYIDPRIRR